MDSQGPACVAGILPAANRAVLPKFPSRYRPHAEGLLHFFYLILSPCSQRAASCALTATSPSSKLFLGFITAKARLAGHHHHDQCIAMRGGIVPRQSATSHQWDPGTHGQYYDPSLYTLYPYVMYTRCILYTWDWATSQKWEQEVDSFTPCATTHQTEREGSRYTCHNFPIVHTYIHTITHTTLYILW